MPETYLRGTKPDGTSALLRLDATGALVVNAVTGGVSADNGDAAKTLTVGTSEPTQRWNTPLTGARAVALSTTGALAGSRFRVVREAGATGAFALNVGTGPLKALAAAAAWADVEYDGTAWRLTAAGTL